jgi:hypothetical protein
MNVLYYIDKAQLYPCFSFEKEQHVVMRERTVNHKNITRIDHPAKRTFGYFVRVCWKGERRSKFFSDKRCGDRLGALDAALQWRNQVEREMGKPRSEHQVVGWSSRNTSGVLGIRRRIKGGYNVFEVTWRSPEGRTHRTSVSIDRYGEKEALRRAKQIRRSHEQMRLASKPGRTTL